MAFSVLFILLFGYVFYINREIADLKKKIDTRRTGSNEQISSGS
jgi:CcmD family protein